MTVNVPKNVNVIEVYGKEHRQVNTRTFEAVMPDAESGADITSLWDIELSPHRSGIYRIARASLSYDESVSGRRTTVSFDVPVEFTSDISLIANGANRKVADELEISRAARDLDRTLMNTRTQSMDTQTVLDDMYKTQTLLLQQGKTMAAEQIHEAMTGIRKGDSLEKTLTGTIYQLELGRNSRSHE